MLALGGGLAALLLVLAVVSLGLPRQLPPLPNPNGYDDFIKAAGLLTGDVGNLLRLGLSRRCSVPTASVMSNIPRLLGDLANLKSLARLLEQEGRLAEMENRHGDAVKSYLDTIRFGNEISRGGFIINRLVGVACEAIGFSPLAKLAPRLSVGDARSLVAALEAVDATRMSWEEVRRNEDSFARYQIGRGFNLITWATTRWQAWRSMKQAQIRHNRVVAHERLLAVEMALRCCRAERGQAPSRLDGLVPDYLSKVPADPFSGRPLIYHLQGTNWLLYSVGADGVDDGGKPAGRGLSAKGDILFDSPW